MTASPGLLWLWMKRNRAVEEADPIPLIPSWRELTDQQRDEIRKSTEGSPVVTYNAIRRITSKPTPPRNPTHE